MEINRFYLIVVVALNLLRFFGTDTAPPGFYVDEAVGAAHVLCVKQTGSDFHGDRMPLFTEGLGAGYYTAPFIYGEVLWTSIFGNTVAAFRSFNALVTALTVLFLFLWLRRRAGYRMASFAALFASISPWAFQFSRIAWDPPLAPMFLFAGLLAFDQLQWKRFRVGIGAVLFALAAYSYPPCRLQAGLFLFIIPGLSWIETFSAIAVFGVGMIPMFLRSLSDPRFSARAKMLAIWSDYPMNPYANEGFWGWLWGAIKQVAMHFDPFFLLVSGDRNLRHSIQSFGMLSWVEGVLLVFGIGYGIYAIVRRRKFLNPPEQGLAIFAWLGILTGILPAALTWEGVPHALRAIGAWPFFILLAAVFADAMTRAWKPSRAVIMACSLLFSCFYFYEYFVNYPGNSIAWFKTEPAPIAQAYDRMVNQGGNCESVRAR